jgi:LAO/AO transport system kinase
VVNKADHDGADRMVQSIAANLSLQTFGPDDWRPPILKTEATTGGGVPELWAVVGQFREHTKDRRSVRQRVRQEVRLRDLLSHEFMARLQRMLPAGEFERVVTAVAERRVDPYTAAADLLHRAFSSPGTAGNP